MPRTAPVPNMIAIPGMNPGLFVLGGGGDGGGSGGGDGKGKGGKQGADGKNGGNDANGGGNGAGNCGAGGPGSCTNCGNRMSAGDPVDVGTGRSFTLAAVDLYLPGLLPLAFSRRYSSHSVERDVGLGFGWCHSLAWEIVPARRTVKIWDEIGTMWRMDMPEPGETVISRGWALTRHDASFVLEIDGLFRVFDVVRDGNYVLSAMYDRNGNRVTLEYDPAGRLVKITDCCGRVVLVDSTPQGRIERLRARNAVEQGQWIAFATYSYDTTGDLSSVRDADGHVTYFTYDADHYLTRYEAPDSPIFHFVYDEFHRCVESWGELRPPLDSFLASTVPAVLADGQTPAKGFMHVKVHYYEDGMREVIDSQQVRRFDVNDMGLVTKGVSSSGAVTTRVFDDNGFMLEHTDAMGGVTSWTRDVRGAVLTTIDPVGNRTEFTRDANGQPLEVTDGVGTMFRASYDAHGNPLTLELSRGEVVTRAYGPGGLLVRQTMPSGGTFVYDYDAQQNLLRSTQPDGTIWVYTYDALGRRLSETNPLGETKRFAYDNRGKLIAIYNANGSVQRFQVNGAGRLSGYQDGDGRLFQAEYLLGRLAHVRYPDGTEVFHRYDREGFLRETVNEKGEVRAQDVNPDGKITRLTSFDGRVQRFTYDGNNRLIRYENGLGERTEYERDAVGQILKVTYPDGAEAAFTYDLRGRLVAAKNDAGEYLYEVDGAGMLLREIHQFGDQRFEVSNEYDVMRLRTRLATSLGHVHEIERDVMGRPTRESLDGAEHVELSFDPLGRELRRFFQRGQGWIDTEWSVGGDVHQRTVRSPLTSGPNLGPGAPSWVGQLPPGTQFVSVFGYSPAAKVMTHRYDSLNGALTFEHDARDQILAARTPNGTGELFSYDSAGNGTEQRSPARYAKGNVLVSRGPAEYDWDADGRLVEKRVKDPDGSIRTWTYEWNGAGMLSRVKGPGGVIVDFAYDPFARRVSKRVSRATGPGSGRAASVSCSRYVWDRGRIVHEICERAASQGDPITEVRTFAYDGWMGLPLAERLEHREPDLATPPADPTTTEPDEWLFHVNDPLGAPEHLAHADGTLATSMRRAVFGKTEVVSGADRATPLRFRGQYDDPETGLHYNRHRYYDPESGRYISQDPSGELLDLNLYRYGQNPLTWVDPMGLVHTATAVFTPAGPGAQPINMGTYQSGYDNEADNYSRQYNAQNGLTPWQNFTERDANGNMIHRTSDTEAQILRDLERRSGPPENLNLQGGHLQINGERPPCSSCHQRMNAFAQANGCSITYNWTGNPNAREIRGRSPGTETYPQ